MVKAIDLIPGDKYGRLMVIRMCKVGGKRMWECLCKCGIVTYQKSYYLRKGIVKSCGCHKLELFVGRNTTHGLHDLPEHKAWENMLSRCYNENTPCYKHYGGRGIKVCKRWRKSFTNFLEDMGRRPAAGYSLDRIDNSEDYRKSNCRWTTQQQQLRNRRGNVKITIDGRTRLLVEWSEESGRDVQAIRYRLRAGIDSYNAVFGLPVVKKRKKKETEL